MVCVVSLEESNVTPETVPFPQCREIRTEPQAASHMDKIIIAASAAICGTVVVAVVIFICCNRKRSLKSEKLRLTNVLAANNGGHNGISTTATSLAGSQVQSPLASMGSMGLSQMGGPGSKDWDQLSMYSSRSIPRARMYHSERPGKFFFCNWNKKFGCQKNIWESTGSVMGSVNGGFIADDARSHVSGYSVNKSANGANLLRSRSLIDGQAQRSVSAMSGRGASYLPPGLHHSGMGPMGHPLSGLHGLGLSPLGMAGLSGSMSAMAGLPTLSGMGLSRAGRNGCSGKSVKSMNEPNGQHKRHQSKSKQSAGQSTKSNEQTDNASGEALTTSTTTLIPAENVPASSTETLSSTTQA